MAELKITQTRGTVGARWNQRESLRTLGLKKIRQSVVREDTPQTRGLIKVVHHLVDVEEEPDREAVDGAAQRAALNDAASGEIERHKTVGRAAN